MKKVALVFVLAVFVPSLVLAWLAVRSLRDQEFVLERQQSLLYQGVADALAKTVQDALTGYQSSFRLETEKLLREGNSQEISRSFDERLRRDWPLAQVGFAVTLRGEILSPAFGQFLADNGRFLANRENAQVYLNPASNLAFLNNASPANSASQSSFSLQNETHVDPDRWIQESNRLPAQVRNVVPQQQAAFSQKLASPEDNSQQMSRVAPTAAGFRQLIGDEPEGTLARFVDNRLNVLLWCRPASFASKPAAKAEAAPEVSSPDPQIVFGAQLALPRLIDGLRPLVAQLDPALREEICVALLDDRAKPVALSKPGFQANWKRPFVATEIGEALPHWEVAVYQLNPAKLSALARTFRLTLGLLIGVLVLAIGIGSWLIVADLNRQITLARQKTDFVSNVSHELKTPLTSIRMFSELLAEGRVPDPDKQRSYLGIITAEAARLTRLINNVLDFARLERGEKKYHFQECDVVSVVRETAEAYRPHLETGGFHFQCDLPPTALWVNGDRDALAQVIVNLVSNAEKYANGSKDIEVRIETQGSPASRVEIKILDRGPGVPRGCEEKIFEKFYRAHDGLSEGIQGSGLGLTLARQIARAHGGDVLYEPRAGGGSCFSLRLPLAPL
jgi:signal transduction histidine kinase